MKKETLFKSFAIALPLLVLLVVELGLRMAGYDQRIPLFKDVEMEGEATHWVMNKEVAKKYFKSGMIPADNPEDVFLKTKTDSTFRIVVQGASTVVGFPFYRSASFPSMLKHRLSQTFPQKNIEVINAGISAINSYTLWDMTDEIIAQNPDVVLIYAGHNEYYGALGVGSTSYIGRYPAMVRFYLKMKDVRLFQWLENVLAKVAKEHENPVPSTVTGMEAMARKQHIAYGSRDYRAGIRQFQQNLDRMLRKYQQHNIPVILSTLVSNQKDLPPFMSEEPLVQNALALPPNPELVKQAETSASVAYALGQAYGERQPDSSSLYYLTAKELDLLRFRAPEAFNKVIVELAEKYNCTAVNMADAFVTFSGENVVGNALLTEHVHPNVAGYFVMADAFYEALRKTNLLGDWSHAIERDEAFQDIPVTLIDSLQGAMIVENLKKSWPFDLSKAGSVHRKQYFTRSIPGYEQLKALDLFNKEVAWDEVMSQSYDWYEQRGNYEQCLRILQSMLLISYGQTHLYYFAGEMCMKMEDAPKAVYYFGKYHQMEQSPLAACKLAEAMIANNRKQDARRLLEEAVAKGSQEPAVTNLLKRLTEATE